MFKKICFFSIIFLFFVTKVFAQNKEGEILPLYYFGVLTNVNDQNMLNITQDLFAAQIRTIEYLVLEDRRTDSFKNLYESIATDINGAEFFALAEEKTHLKNAAILFCARIYRPQSDENWECAFFAKNTSTSAVVARRKKYDSYYKILSDAKTMIQSVISEAVGKEGNLQPLPQVVLPEKGNSPQMNMENIAGTWGGEENISKIILMRSGRGFIVFANGATMNVSLSFVNDGGEQRLRVLQQDRFNASYYPDIDRKTVLAYAEKALPIEWNLDMVAQGALEGTKKTLALKAGGVQNAIVDVKWVKRF